MVQILSAGHVWRLQLGLVSILNDLLLEAEDTRLWFLLLHLTLRALRRACLHTIYWLSWYCALRILEFLINLSFPQIQEVFCHSLIRLFALPSAQCGTWKASVNILGAGRGFSSFLTIRWLGICRWLPCSCTRCSSCIQSCYRSHLVPHSRTCFHDIWWLLPAIELLRKAWVYILSWATPFFRQDLSHLIVV